MREEVRIIQTL